MSITRHATPVSRRRWLGGAAAGAVGLATLSAAGAARGASPDAAVRLAPAVLLPASDGLPVLAEQPLARATYVDFWASWCGPCEQSFPWMQSMHTALAAQGLRIVAIGLDRQPEPARRFLNKQAAAFAVALDPQALSAKAFEVMAMPSSFLVGPGRRLLWSHRGFRHEDRAALESALRAALA